LVLKLAFGYILRAVSRTRGRAARIWQHLRETCLAPKPTSRGSVCLPGATRGSTARQCMPACARGDEAAVLGWAGGLPLLQNIGTGALSLADCDRGRGSADLCATGSVVGRYELAQAELGRSGGTCRAISTLGFMVFIWRHDPISGHQTHFKAIRKPAPSRDIAAQYPAGQWNSWNWR
jgi:hypothetical protein